MGAALSDDILAKYPAVRGKPEAMALFCIMLRDRGLHADALAMGRAAVAAAPDSMAVLTEVRSVLSNGVQEFHRPMLLDRPRNRAYAEAIARLVKPGMIVLEIGAGAGLLAMLAARAGAEVYACEGNPMIAAAARENVGRNGLADRIRIIPKLSTDLAIPGDLPAPADLVIHEIFGARLFDEGVTASLEDARRRLVKPGAPSIPHAAELRAALVRRRQPSEPRGLDDIEGFDLSAFELLASTRKWAKADEVELVSAPASALAMDYDLMPPFGPACETVGLTAYGGLVEGVAQWLRIDFGDGKRFENDELEGGNRSSWGVEYSALPTPIETIPGDMVDLTFRHRAMLLTIDAAKRAG